MMSELRYRTAVPIFFRRNGKAPFRSSFLKFARLIPSISAASGWSNRFGSTAGIVSPFFCQVSQLRDHLPFLRDAQHSGFGQWGAQLCDQIDRRSLDPDIHFQTSLIQYFR